MWTALWALLGAAAAVVTWWVQTEPRRRKARLLQRVRALEHDIEQAVARGDSARLVLLHRELERLREDAHLA